jgi:DNA-binding Lrp family transcriptional regulator
MPPALADRVLEILQGSPSGLTAREVAERLGKAADNISSRLSKLAAYGIIKKTRGRIAYDTALCAIYHAPSSASSTSNKSSVESP